MVVKNHRLQLIGRKFITQQVKAVKFQGNYQNTISSCIGRMGGGQSVEMVYPYKINLIVNNEVKIIQKHIATVTQEVQIVACSACTT